MLSYDEFIKKNKKLKRIVNSEIRMVDQGASQKNKSQLELIQKELTIMLEKRGYPLSYPRVIVDNWSYTDDLGIELLDLAQIYKRL